jgi:hypothetical protein
MSWFNKHLHWTYGITLIILSVFSVLAAISISQDIAGLLIFSAICLVISVVLNIAAGVWVLNQKGQNVAYIAILFVFSLAFILIVFFLPNKKSQNNMQISDAEYYKSRTADTK